MPIGLDDASPAGWHRMPRGFPLAVEALGYSRCQSPRSSSFAPDVSNLSPSAPSLSSLSLRPGSLCLLCPFTSITGLSPACATSAIMLPKTDLPGLASSVSRWSSGRWLGGVPPARGVLVLAGCLHGWGGFALNYWNLRTKHPGVAVARHQFAC